MGPNERTCYPDLRKWSLKEVRLLVPGVRGPGEGQSGDSHPGFLTPKPAQCFPVHPGGRQAGAGAVSPGGQALGRDFNLTLCPAPQSQETAPQTTVLLCRCPGFVASQAEGSSSGGGAGLKPEQLCHPQPVLHHNTGSLGAMGTGAYLCPLPPSPPHPGPGTGPGT